LAVQWLDVRAVRLEGCSGLCTVSPHPDPAGTLTASFRPR
jgi:hypothetical protein